MKHQWNTGRQYDEHGQRMVAEVHKETLTNDPRIYFSDLSRHINGYVPLGMWAQTADKYAIETLVMTNYDFGNYSPSSITLEWKEAKC
jgi:hypothetical protein